MTKCLIGALALLVTVGCSRKAGESSNISLSLPGRTTSARASGQKSVASMDANSPVLSHVVINVTGSGLAPIVKMADRHKGAMPTTFDLGNVSRGDRLIQVLAVYQSPVNNAMTFYYGDVTKALTLPEEKIEIAVTSLSAATETISGDIFGRYFTSPSGGPTADVAIMFNPGAGRQRMIIEHTTMFNGWFNIFALNNVSFEYEIQNSSGANELMFGGPVNLNSDVFNPKENAGAEANRRTRMAMPIHLRAENGGANSFSSEEAKYYVWGFWGNAAAKADTAGWNARSVCRDTSISGSLTKMKKYSPTEANWPTQPNLFILNFVGIGSNLPAESSLLNQTESSYGSVTFLGGTSGTCPSPSGLYTNFLKVSKDLIDGNGGDSAGGFRPPFKMNATLQAFNVDNSAARVISGDLLPGVSIDQIRIYKKTNVGFDVDNDDGLECPDAAGITDLGYSIAGSAVPDSTGHFSVNTNITSIEVTAGVSALVCSVAGGRLLMKGQSLGPWNFSGPMGGGPPTKFSIAAPTAWNTASVARCMPVRVDLQTASGDYAQVSAAVTVNINLTGGGGLYDGTDSNCGTSLGNTVGFTTPSVGGGNFDNSVRFYVKIPGMTATGSTITIAASDAAAILPAINKVTNIVAQGTVSNFMLTNMSGAPLNSMLFDTCLPVKLLAVDSMMMGVSFLSGQANITSTVAGAIHPDPTCSTALTVPVTFSGSTNSYANLYLKVPSGGNGSLYGLGFNVVQQSGHASANFQLNLGFAGVAQTIRLTPFVITPAPSTCSSYYVGAYDAGGNLANLNSQLDVQLQAAGGGQFLSGSCGGTSLGAQVTVGIGAGTPAAVSTVYFAAAAGSNFIQASTTGANYNLQGFYTIAPP